MRSAIMPGFLSVDEKGVPPVSIKWIQFLQTMPDMPGVYHLADADEARRFLPSIVKLGPPRGAPFNLFHASQREFEGYLGRNAGTLDRYFGQMEGRLDLIQRSLGPVTRTEVLAMGAHRLTRTEYEAVSHSVQMAMGLMESYRALPRGKGRHLMALRHSLVAELQSALGNLAVRTEVRRAMAQEVTELGLSLTQGACFYLNQVGGFYNRIHHVPQVGKAMAGIALLFGVSRIFQNESAPV